MKKDGTASAESVMRLYAVIRMLAVFIGGAGAPACWHAQAPVAALAPNRVPTLPPAPSRAVPEAPPPGVQLRLISSQKAALVALLQAGQAAFAQGNYSLAEHTWLEAAELDPSNVEARLGLGRVWLLRGVATDDASFRKKAREAFAFVVLSCPDNAQARRLLSLVHADGAD